MATTSKTETVEELLRRVAELEAENLGLKRIVEEIPSARPSKIKSHIPLWIIIREHLRSEGGSASPRGITDALVEQGNNLGKYPLRTVKIALTSPAMQSIFKVTKSKNGDELVSLYDTPATYAPRNTEGVRARAARVARRPSVRR